MGAGHQRVSKTVSGTGGYTTYYVGRYYEVKDPDSGNDVITKYYYFGSQRVAMKVDNTTYYLRGDHLGSTSVVLDNAGAVYSRRTYYSYGEGRTQQGSALPTDFTFTGQRFDVGELMDYGAREYDFLHAQFLQPDSIVPNPMDPQSLNRYAYVRNNPINRIDPTGNAPQFPSDDPNNLDPCATDWCWQNRWYEAHGMSWSDKKEHWFAGGDPTFYDEAIMDEVIGEAGIQLTTASRPQKEVIARAVSVFGSALSGGIPQLRELLGETTIYIGAASPVFCRFGSSPCVMPSLRNMTHEMFIPQGSFDDYGEKMHMIVVHELGHVIDFQSKIGLDSEGLYGGSFSDAWAYRQLTDYGRNSRLERFADAVGVYVFGPDYFGPPISLPNPLVTDLNEQMDRMRALLEGWN